MAASTLHTAPPPTRAGRYNHDPQRPAAYLPAAEMEIGRLLLPAGPALPPVERLLVLVPDEDLDEAAFARQVWKLAAPRQLAVAYLGWTASADTEARLRRRLANLAALTRDDGIVVSARPALGAGWRAAIRGLWRSGDLIVCHAEQRVQMWGVLARPLGASLVAALSAPVYVLSGFCPAPTRPVTGLFAQVTTLLLSGTVVSASFWLQVQISRLPSRPWQAALLAVSVVVEFGLLWGWNRYSS